MGNSQGTSSKEASRPFLVGDNDPQRWQHAYKDAVVIANALQRHGFDPDEASHIREDQIHMIFMAEKIFSFDERVIFDIAVHLLAERHRHSYGY